MDRIETQALYLRSRAALALIREGHLTPYDGLAIVVAPTRKVLEASIVAAQREREKGRVRSDDLIVTIDDLAAR